MKIDYAKQNPRGGPSSQGVRVNKNEVIPPTLPTAMVVFTLLVLLAGVAAYHYHRTQLIQAPITPPESNTNTEFDFYEVLPEVNWTTDSEDPFGPSVGPSPQKAVGNYFIQAGSFRAQEQAIQLVTMLQQRHYTAFWQATSLPNQGTWFRVYIGPYEEAEQAKSAQFKLDGQLVPESFIIRGKVRGVP